MNSKTSESNGMGPVKSIPANLISTREIELKVKSYAGFASSKKNHMFCWFFESQKCMAHDDPKNFPLMIWLNGGPGASSMFGLITENGPYLIQSTDTGSIVENPNAWNQDAHIMYWDNPVGAGYSYNENGHYMDSEDELSEVFYDSLQVFFDTYPQYRACPLYVTGESYGGKYIPAISTKIMTKNREHRTAGNKDRIVNLKGLSIGNPWMDAVMQTRFRLECGYTLGFVDTKQHSELMKQYELLPSLIEEQQWEAAFDLNQSIKNELVACGGNIAIYDVRMWDEDSLTPLVEKYFRLSSVKKALNVPEDIPWNCADETGPVTDHLISDLVSNTIGYLPDLLNEKNENGDPAYRVLLYTGNLDMSCGFRGTEQILYDLKWDHDAAWKNLDRKVWAEPRGNTMGFIKSYKNLTQIVIPCSGHMVPTNQPVSSLKMMNNFIFEKEFPCFDPLKKKQH